ncbi:hypothetical protein LDENG_00138230 [Lucifuga dentata]|nr:hypothetical protein LDENG_00138230 [Lucifuga dentata]
MLWPYCKVLPAKQKLFLIASSEINVYLIFITFLLFYLQLLVAFDALKSIGIIHADVKPDNVMLVNHKDEPFRVKLIDFGVACHCKDVKPYHTCMIMSYRPPEVLLGLKYTEAVDMWGLGCLLASLFLGYDLFCGRNEYDAMPQEYHAETGTKSENTRHQTFRDLSEMRTVREWADVTEEQDVFQFVDLLKGLLTLDPAKRITPTQALQHPFITTSDLQFCDAQVRVDPGQTDSRARVSIISTHLH